MLNIATRQQAKDSAAPPPTRRAELLRIAAKLIAERGYHSVGMDDIGEAVGISGPALYRHFKGKQQMLGEILIEPSERLVRAARERISGLGSPMECLDTLVAFHSNFTSHGVDIPRIFYNCANELSQDDKNRLEKALRDYAEIWVAQIAAIRPELKPDEILTAVQAVFRVFNLPHDQRQSATKQKNDLITLLATSALHGFLEIEEHPADRPIN